MCKDLKDTAQASNIIEMKIEYYEIKLGFKNNKKSKSQYTKYSFMILKVFGFCKRKTQNNTKPSNSSKKKTP